MTIKSNFSRSSILHPTDNTNSPQPFSVPLRWPMPSKIKLHPFLPPTNSPSPRNSPLSASSHRKQKNLENRIRSFHRTKTPPRAFSQRFLWMQWSNNPVMMQWRSITWLNCCKRNKLTRKSRATAMRKGNNRSDTRIDSSKPFSGVTISSISMENRKTPILLSLRNL